MFFRIPSSFPFSLFFIARNFCVPLFVVMNSEAFRNQCCKDAEFNFALNDSSLSDRIIQLEISKDLNEVFLNVESGSTSAEQTNLSKRRREDIQKNNGITNIFIQNSSLHCVFFLQAKHFFEFSVLFNSLSWVIINIGDESANGDDTANLHMDYSVVVKVKTLYVNSSLLASKSSFFYKVDISSLLVRFHYFS